MTDGDALVTTLDEGPSMVIVRDRDRAVIEQPPRDMFRARHSIVYVHAGTDGRLPESRRYLFNLDHVDDVSHARAAGAFDRGAQVTVVVRRLDTDRAAALEDSGWNVIPAYGDTEHVGARTARRALRLAYDGHHVVATGFLRNSAVPDARRDDHHPSAFLHLMSRMSIEAHRGDDVVAAVLSPHRTGSKWLRDLIGWTAGSRVRVFHEHAIPDPTGDWPEWPCFADALALEHDTNQRKRMRQAALRRLLLSARRRYIFVTDRDPVERLVSYFVKRHARWLRAHLDESGGSFRDRGVIQRQFETWLRGQVAHHARWFRRTLLEPFDLDIRSARPTADGLLVAARGANTLIVVPTERLTALREIVEGEFGAGSVAALDDNSAAGHGNDGLLAVVRRDLEVPASIVRALLSIPEIASRRALAPPPDAGATSTRVCRLTCPP
jgi:hypothetical protein